MGRGVARGRSADAGVHPLEERVPLCHAGGMNLVRPRRGRVIAGVCAAIANRYQWNPTTVRVLTVASFILPGTQVIVYIILWILIPKEV